MTNDQIRIAVAKECGIKFSHQLIGATNKVSFFDDCPNFPESLDAKMDAFNTLNPEEKMELMLIIMDLARISMMWKQCIIAVCTIEAFEEWFCEAFLRLKGKWIK